LAISPNGHVLTSANGPSNDVSIIDAEHLVVIEKVAVSNGPWGAACAEAK
jgi:YVTN family beta-propeller protein